MNIAVLGSAGQLGRELCPRLRGDVTPLARADVDVTDAASLRARLTNLRPDVVVNCSAYNLVDKAESEPQAAFAVNAWAVRDLAAICRDLGSYLVHFSTDYVFGLEAGRTTPWGEDDAPGPVSVYGVSKLAGEYLVRSVCPRHLVVRTCGLYGLWGSGGKGGNFVETMLRLAGQGKPLHVVADQRCTPSYAADVAHAAAALIDKNAHGVVHVTNEGDCTWHEFAAEIFRRAGLTPNLTAITSHEFKAAAQRPAYSVLRLGRLQSFGISRLRNWREALAAYFIEKQSR